MAYKHDYDKTLFRLTTILTKLNDGDVLSVKELAEEFNVSARTIQRDFNERLISFPIYQENKKWKMQAAFQLQKSRSIEDEVILDIMEKLIESAGNNFSIKASKLLSKIKNGDFNPIYTKLNIEDIGDKLKEVQLLESAIKSKMIINCQYDFETQRKDMTLKPLKIVNYEGFWYLVALDSRNDILKKYYLKNIFDIKITDELFKIDSALDKVLENSLSVWFQHDKEPFEIKLHANQKIAKYFERKPLPTQTITSTNEDGGIDFNLKITHEMEIIPIIKYWLPHLKVLEPQWIKDLIINDLVEFQKNI
jgi:predicted DNA-binding transcriptional regulator YafY